MSKQPQVYAVLDKFGSLVLLCRRTGRLHMLSPAAARLYCQIVKADDIESAIGALTMAHPDSDRPRVAADLKTFIDELARRQLLGTRVHISPYADAAVTHGIESRPTGTPMALAPRAQPRRISSADRICGFVAGCLAVVMLRLPFPVMCRITESIKKHWCWRDATRAEARAALDAVHLLLWRYPGRIACMEASLATVFAAAVRGRRADLCIGSAADPRRFHAWVEIGGRPVSSDGEQLAGYLRMVAI